MTKRVRDLDSVTWMDGVVRGDWMELEGARRQMYLAFFRRGSFFEIRKTSWIGRIGLEVG